MRDHNLYLNCALEQEFLKSLKLPDKNQLNNSLIQLCDFYIGNFCCEDVVKLKVMELLFSMTREAVELGVPFDEIVEIKNNVLEKFNSQKTMEDLCKWVENEVLDLYSNKLAQYLTCRKKKLIEQVKHFLDENYTQNITLDVVASKVYLSRSYLAHSFKKETGNTIMAYLANKRIEEAKKLLTNSNLSIAQIADAVGYGDISYFGRIFNKKTGYTPSEYRDIG